MSDSHAEQARAILAYERHIQELADAEMERVRQLQGSTIPSTTTTPSAGGKSILEQALDRHETRTSGLDHILGTPPAPAPKAAPTAPQGPAKSVLDAAMDRHDARKAFPC